MKTAKIWEEKIMIPTYEVGKPDKNPIFLENRVYQGSSGKIYPYPTIEKISDQKTKKNYQAVFLENEYLKIMILPELGGRIQRAYDKTNQYDFVYYNEVIKPALVGLCGPWISGGIEFNWPQHHRPTTFSPVDHEIVKNKDGSVSCLVHDVDQMYGTQVTTAFTLYPEKAFIEIKNNLYNRTAIPQTFLWWANPAVPVNDYTQTIFPPDVHAVMDHGKRDVSSFPIATGIYYKHDYSAGVDISRYKNIVVPTSYMAEKSSFDFMGGYDYKVGAGLLHIADHHISPGKKQWTWGSGEFGKAWDRNLTDNNGPYIELMAGVYTDNQPDFSWLMPMEEKSFKQYFMPYKAVGPVKNASIHACLNLEHRKEGIYVCVYAAEKYPHAEIILSYDGKIIFDKKENLSPVKTFETIIKVNVKDDTKLHISVLDEERELVSFTPLKEEIPNIPKPAEAALDPEKILSNEELYLTGRHIEQYRHATYQPDPYYLEGLKRDPNDIRLNNAYGLLMLRRGNFKEAETYFSIAIRRLTWKNPNSYNSEPYYNLGLVLLFEGERDKAFDAFYKACWSEPQQEMGYYYLAVIESQRGNWESALAFCERGLTRNSRNTKARALKVYLYRKLSRKKEALQAVSDNLSQDTFDYVSRLEQAYLDSQNRKILLKKINMLCRNFHETYLNMARDYMEYGAYTEALGALSLCTVKNPLISYYKAYCLMKMGKASLSVIKSAGMESSDYVFPNKLEDIAVLRYAVSVNKDNGKAAYYLGNLYYDKLQYDEAISLWEQSSLINPEFPITWRNLALAYYNKRKEPDKARKAMEKARKLAPNDARIFLELDQLYRKIKMPLKKRVKKYEEAKVLFMQRDDLIIEYITLQNMLGHYNKAYKLAMSHHFHPWEGGEGKITTQYKISLVEIAMQYIKKEDWIKSIDCLKKALIYPNNLGEGKLEGCMDNDINYYLGYCFEKENNSEEAEECYKKASVGADEPGGMMFYNDQPADMIYYQGLAKEALGKMTEAKAKFSELSDYGKKHLSDKMRMEYFAVSFPDFLIFDDNLNERNRVHCYYLMGLGALGIGKGKEAAKYFEAALKEDPFHQNAGRYLAMCK